MLNLLSFGRSDPSIHLVKIFLLCSGIISASPLIPLYAQDVVKDGITVVDPESVLRPTAQAVRINSPISVDGFLDESVWQEAEIITVAAATVCRGESSIQDT